MSSFFLRTIFFVAIIFLSCGKNDSDIDRVRITNDSGHVNKIISLAPSVTEMLTALQLDDKIVGVTRFCNVQNMAERAENMAILTERGYEQILRINPDLAIILAEQKDLITFLDSYNIRYITVASESIAEILASIKKIADANGVGERGDSLVRNLQERIDSLTHLQRATTAPPRVLLCVYRGDVLDGGGGAIYAAGANSFYNELITLAGGVNVLANVAQAYPAISSEAVMRLDPDVIIDLTFAHAEEPRESACDYWRSFHRVGAVKNGRVHCLTGDYLTIPGPRVIEILERLSSYFFM